MVLSLWLSSCSPSPYVHDPGQAAVVDGSVSDSGENMSIPTGSGKGPWIRVKVGSNQACAQSESGQLDCWLLSEQLSSIDYGFDAHEVAINAGVVDDFGSSLYHVCLLKAGTIRCSGCGRRDVGQCDVQAGSSFDGLFVGSNWSCGLSDQEAMKCWGNQGLRVFEDIPASPLQLVSMDAYVACGIGIEGELTCWGSDDFGVVSSAPKGGVWSAVAVGVTGACAIEQQSGGLTCWGSGEMNETAPAKGAGWKDVSYGLHSMCGVDSAGYVRCWGEDRYGLVSGAPIETVTSVSLGNRVASAVSTEGAVLVWGCWYGFCDDGLSP